MLFEMFAADGKSSDCITLFQMSRMRSTTDAENSASSSFAKVLPFQSSLWHRHDGSPESVGSRKSNPNIECYLSWDSLPPGSTQAGHDSYRDLFHTATVLACTHDAKEVFIMDHGSEFGADFQHLCQSIGILLVVTEWGNAVAKFRRRATWGVSQVAFEKASSLEAPTSEAEVIELIDFMFAELNRRVGRAGFSPGQRFFVRQLRLPSSLRED